jgi:transcriptional regulator with XRE-family HTH domain
MENNFSYIKGMNWKFGEYIETLLLQKKWSANRLSQELNMSPSYVQYLIKGYTTGKKDPPNPTTDVMISLSKTLNVPIFNLIEAYQGREPKTNNISRDALMIVRAILSSLPEEALIHCLQEMHIEASLERMLLEGKN